MRRSFTTYAFEQSARYSFMHERLLLPKREITAFCGATPSSRPDLAREPRGMLRKIKKKEIWNFGVYQCNDTHGYMSF
jgi:hypothetical protein